MLLGEFLQKITKNPSRIFNLDPASTANQRFYISNETEKGACEGVICYRRILPGEISKLRRKILLFTIKDTCPGNPDNEEIKRRFIELSNLLV